MTLRDQWRDFICDKSRPDRFLSSIGSSTTAANAPQIDPEVLESFVAKLAGGGADLNLLADAIDLAHGDYTNFCASYLRPLLDSLSNERVGEDAIVGPALRGQPRWDRTILSRKSGRIPATHYVARLPVRSFSLPENLLVRWLVDSLFRLTNNIVERVGTGNLPPAIRIIVDACTEALTHQWFRQVLPPAAPSSEMFRAARQQRLPGYRMASNLATRRAARDAGSRASRWLRTLDLLRANWLIPEKDSDVFELFAVALVLDVLATELKLGEPLEYGLTVSGRSHIALFSDQTGGIVRVFFDQSAAVVLNAPSLYRDLVNVHTGISGVARRPDIIVTRRAAQSNTETVMLLEVKDTADPTYISDSLYKAMGYIQDYSTLWKNGSARPKVALLFPDTLSLKAGVDVSTLDVVLFSSFDRNVLARALSSSLGLPAL